MIFCTLFDSNYLDKGLALYESMKTNLAEFTLYILAMDIKCEEILKDLSYEYIKVINLSVFINQEELQRIYSERSKAEFCWTCTPHLRDYILKKYNVDSCRYVDADVYFYGDCSCLIEEMGQKPVQIVEHRFTRKIEDKIAEKQSGKYCVEFNTFKNTKEGLRLLQWWKEKCRESCGTDMNNSMVFGDQKYLEHWENNKNVSILQNEGGGVAPWNIAQYKLISKDEDGKKIIIINKKTKKKFELIFYHFHNITYREERVVDISVYQRAWGVDDTLVNTVYRPYLLHLEKIREMLKEKYDFSQMIKIHPSFEERIIYKRTVKDMIASLKGKGIHDLYVVVYLNINNIWRKILQEKKNTIHF